MLGFKSALRHWLAVIANGNQAFSIRHEGVTQREVRSDKQKVLHSHMRTSCANNFRYLILDIPITDEIHMEDRWS